MKRGLDEIVLSEREWKIEEIIKYVITVLGYIMQ